MRGLPPPSARDERLKAHGGARQARPAACQHDPGARCIFCCCAARSIRCARFYATLGGTARRRGRRSVPALSPISSRSIDSEIAALIETRVTNTNEVGRSAVLHPGFRAVAAEAGAPLNLIEIGPSAGLNLIWDRYGVRYHARRRSRAELAPRCAARDRSRIARGAGAAARPGAGGRRAASASNSIPSISKTPMIATGCARLSGRISPARLDRLDRAIALLRSRGTAVEIRRGDALENLLPGLARDPGRRAGLRLPHHRALSVLPRDEGRRSRIC